MCTHKESSSRPDLLEICCRWLILFRHDRLNTLWCFTSLHSATSAISTYLIAALAGGTILSRLYSKCEHWAEALPRQAWQRSHHRRWTISVFSSMRSVSALEMDRWRGLCAEVQRRK